MSNREDEIKKLEESYQPISLNQLTTEAEEINRYETFIVNSNGEHSDVIKFNTVFGQKKIEKLLKEFSEKIGYTQENNINYFKDDEDVANYLCFLMIKYFSHFGKEISDEFERQIVQMNALLELGYFEMFFNEIFDNREVARVFEKFYSMGAAAEEIQKAQLEAQIQASELENKLKAVQGSKKTKKK